MWFGDGRSTQEASEDGGQVEAVLDLGEVAMGVLDEIERMVGSREGGRNASTGVIDGSVDRNTDSCNLTGDRTDRNDDSTTRMRAARADRG